MDLDYTNQLRRLVTSLSKSLPMQEVRLIERYELASFAGFPGFRRGIMMAIFQESGTKAFA